MNRRDLFKDINNYSNFKVKLRGFYVVKEQSLNSEGELLNFYDLLPTTCRTYD